MCDFYFLNQFASGVNFSLPPQIEIKWPLHMDYGFDLVLVHVQ